MTVTNFQRPGQAGTLDLAGPAQRYRCVGRLARRRKERLRVDGLAYPTGTPGYVVLPLVKGPEKSRILTCSGDFVRAWHSRPSHSTHLPRGSGLFNDAVELMHRCRRRVLPHSSALGQVATSRGRKDRTGKTDSSHQNNVRPVGRPPLCLNAVTAIRGAGPRPPFATPPPAGRPARA